MKNKKLISRLENLKKLGSIEIIEGSMLKSLKGGKAPCTTKCGSNDNSCNSKKAMGLENNV